jgi:hypothetical protein
MQSAPRLSKGGPTSGPLEASYVAFAIGVHELASWLVCQSDRGSETGGAVAFVA